MKRNDSNDDTVFPLDPGPDTGPWNAEVDYFAGWRESRQTAQLLGTALASIGMEPWECRTVAGSAENGAPLIRLIVTHTGAAKLARLLEAAAHVGLTVETS